MRTKPLLRAMIASATLISCAPCADVFAQQPGDANVPGGPSNNIDDNRVTAQIRAAVAADDLLSTASKGVSILTNQEAVILRGVVSSGEDKDRVETLAGQYAGSRQIQNELTISDNQDQAGHHLAEQPGR